MNAQVVCITEPSPVAAPFVCQFLSSASAVCQRFAGRPWIIFCFSPSWATAFWEDKHNIHLVAGENPTAFFQLPVQRHAELAHSLCIVTFKMLRILQHLTFFFWHMFSLLCHVNNVLWDPGILLLSLLYPFEKDSNLLQDFLPVFKPASCQPVGCSNRWRVWWPFAFIPIRMKLEWTDKIGPGQSNVWFMSWTLPRRCFSLYAML